MKYLIALLFIFVVACDTGPQCIQSHDESKWDYGYGYGYGYTTGYNPTTGKVEGHYGWSYGYGYGYHTETICDVYASPTP